MLLGDRQMQGGIFNPKLDGAWRRFNYLIHQIFNCPKIAGIAPWPGLKPNDERGARMNCTGRRNDLLNLRAWGRQLLGTRNFCTKLMHPRQHRMVLTWVRKVWRGGQRYKVLACLGQSFKTHSP